MNISYKISNTSFAGLNAWLQNKHFSSVFVLSDSNTANWCYPVFQANFVSETAFQQIIVSAGEEYKNLETTEKIWRKLLEADADRNSLIVNLGGGVVSDLGAFAASVFKRGIPYINLPTTYLSMVDAAFGGKTGVNFDHFKNQIGSFYFPDFVFVYLPFLKTLDQRQFLAGWGEVVKYALISDFSLWESLGHVNFNENEEASPKIIKKCISIKESIVQADAFELNLRKKLNFGHTCGHAIESLILERSHKAIPHGLAVAAGCLIESTISCKMKLLPIKMLEEIRNLLLQKFGKISLQMQDVDLLTENMKKDKKNLNQNINFTLIDRIGHAVINQIVPEKIIKESLLEYMSI